MLERRILYAIGRHSLVRINQIALQQVKATALSRVHVYCLYLKLGDRS